MNMPLRNWGLALVPALLLAAPAMAAQFHVAPDGTPAGDGSIERPWDLATALRPHPSIKPMDTVWLRKGIYRGAFISRLKGAPNAPVIVRAYPGERAVLDGADRPAKTLLRIEGAWAWYWNLEFTDSNPYRGSAQPEAEPGARGHGLDIQGADVKVINCVVHNVGTGIGFWRPAVNSELYGLLIFDTGWRAPDRTHGPSIYTQSKDGWKIIRDNILFNSMRHNMQLYGSGSAFLENYRLQGNVNFNGRWLTGGGGPLKNIVFEENLFYRNTAEFGYQNRQNENLAVRNNYLPVHVSILGWDRMELTGNTIFLPGRAAAALNIESHHPTTLDASRFSGNTYVVGNPSQQIAAVTRVGEDSSKTTARYALAQWQAEFKFDQDSQAVTAPQVLPDQPRVFVRRNHYEPNRGHVVIYNWPRRDEVDVDISVMNPREGDRWELRNVQNYFQETASGVYEGGALRVRMTGWTAANPFGEDKPVQPSTFPEFGVFVLTLDRAAPAASHNGADSRRAEGAPGAIVTTEVADRLVEEPAVAPSAGEDFELEGIAVHLRDSAGHEAAAPLLAVNPHSVSYAVPGEFETGPMTITILKNGQRIDGGSMFLQGVAPALFTMDGREGGPAVGYVRQGLPDGGESVQPLSACDAGSCRAVPVTLSGAAGDPVLTLFGTAFRKPAPGAKPGATLASLVTELIAIEADGFYPGLDLIRVRISRSTPERGDQLLKVTLDHLASNAVTVALQ
jgi:uncharacterized protein (TIGR03437 family)